MTIRAHKEGVKLVVLDPDGRVVHFEKLKSDVKNGAVTFKASWKVNGRRGDILNYTVMVFDADGMRSSNTAQVTVVVK